MNSNSAGDLVKVRVAAGMNLQSSPSPCVYNSQLLVNNRKASSAVSLGFYGRLNTKKKASCHRQFSNVKGNGSIFLPAAALKETLENQSLEAPSSECIDSQSLIRSELNALDAYFNKLQRITPSKEVCTQADDKPNNDLSVSKSVAPVGDELRDDSAVKSDLRSIEMYLESLAKGSNIKESTHPFDIPKLEHELENLTKETAPNLPLTSAHEITDEESDLDMDEPSGLASTESSAVYVLAAINIAVYLFGLASPVETSGIGTSTLPLLYGAKVNDLLLNGEWWRLITPMFLHSGFFHVVLSSWALLFFGPQVENVFGPLAFCMIYFLGGLCGNMCSFFFTPAATVGGTGPVFALFSAWVAYLWQNKKVLGEKSADYGIKATTLMGILVLCLSCLLPTDEWIHVGAILPGVLFGAFSAPRLEIAADGSDDTEAKNTGTREGAYAMSDSPSILSLTVGFAISTALCFGLFNILAPVVEESQLLDSIPF